MLSSIYKKYARFYMEPLKDKKVILIACASCAAVVECVAEHNTIKHIVAALLCTGCTIYGGRLAYEEACKAATGIQMGLKEGAKAVKEKATEELAKPKF
jgi:hypothetical protein